MTEQTILTALVGTLGTLATLFVALRRGRQDTQSSFRDALLKEVMSLRESYNLSERRFNEIVEGLHQCQREILQLTAERNALHQQVEELTREVAALKRRHR